MADETTVATGPGPGGDAVSVRMIVLLAIYLAALTALLLWNIYRKWPACGVVCADQVAASATPSPSPTPTPTASPTPAATPTITPAPSPTAPPETTTTPPTTTPSPSVVIESVSPKTSDQLHHTGND